MEIIDNTSKTLRDDLSVEIKKGSKLSIAAACFSIYAFQELKKELKDIDELRFIFTSPTFTTEKAKKEKREFYIPRLNRERSLYGTEFEIKLRNEMTQKAIAKECAEWIKSKVIFKSNVTNENMMGFINVDDKSYMPVNGFTTVDLGCERGNNAYNFVQKTDAPFSTQYLDLFNSIWKDECKLQVVTDEIIENITVAYNENSPEFIYFVTLYNIFNEFLEDISEDVLPNEATGFKDSKIWGMLYNFQKDAALAIINKLEKYNGCILADSVGLGKTFTALAVIKYYENRNKSVLVLCPKKLTNNWNTYKDNYVNNPIAADRLRYDVLYHTDLNRIHGFSNGLDLSRLNWGNYDLVVIDESHNFRNGGKLSGEDNEKENRYLRLLNKVVRAGVKTKVLMLSATPVNNRFNDLKNQLALAYEGNTDFIDTKLNTTRSIDDIFRNAQKSFNTWSKWDTIDRTTDNLLRMLDFDFFEVLDSVTIARSRKHIQRYYDTTDIGSFPTRLKPISLQPHLTDLKAAINYNEIFEQLMLLTLSIYTPSHYILASKIEKYAELYDDSKISVGFTQANREQGIRRLMAINLMKRMESSVYSFNLTLKRIKNLISETIEKIDDYDKFSSVKLDLTDISDVDEFDAEDQNDDELFSFGKKVKIDLADMDYDSWRQTLKKDYEILELLTFMVEDITPEWDNKLQELLALLKNKIEHPINGNNKKVIIFTAFSDTAEYLYNNVSEFVKKNFSLDTAMITGTIDGKTTANLKHKDLNTVLTCFSPVSKDKDLLMPNDNTNIDVLIATDCISEGQNLQDCDYLINYDIHWNPVRIIQRFGRIDRIGSKNA
ncbi:MAG: DEAD/DEAH box helicase family protein, partial [Clostridiales bacterium]|nr:DEAD/DEAH box helicase family protein [Candidatus Coliplasma equi]